MFRHPSFVSLQLLSKVRDAYAHEPQINFGIISSSQGQLAYHVGNPREDSSMSDGARQATE